MTRPIRVLGFAGSLRRASYNRALLRAAQELAPSDMAIDIFDLDAVPLYNADVEAVGDPEPVTRFKSAIGQADALLLAAAEYNHGISGVMKNAIDWASRPPQGSALSGKPVALLGASPGMTGTARAQAQLRPVLMTTNCYVMPKPEILVPQAPAKFDRKGRLVDQPTRELLRGFLEMFVTWCGHFAAAPG
jgi:chromate reductase